METERNLTARCEILPSVILDSYLHFFDTREFSREEFCLLLLVEGNVVSLEFAVEFDRIV